MKKNKILKELNEIRLFFNSHQEPENRSLFLMWMKVLEEVIMLLDQAEEQNKTRS